jgi:hypothetical protein
VAGERRVSVLVAVLIVVLLGVVVLVLSAPLRAVRRPGVGGDGVGGDGAGRDPSEESGSERADRAALQAAREAKYREIRDAEMDYRTGKLSQEDYAAIDGVLRAEAVAILDRLRGLGEEPGEVAGKSIEEPDGGRESEEGGGE